MSAPDADNDDSLAVEYARLDATLDGLETRVGNIEEELRLVRDDLRSSRAEMRRWFVALFVALSALVAVLQFLL